LRVGNFLKTKNIERIPSRFCFSQDFLVFDEGFFLEWGKSLVIGTNYFSDHARNVLNIKFDENLVAGGNFVVFFRY